MRSTDFEIVVEGKVIRVSGARLLPPEAGSYEKVIGDINFGPFQALLRIPDGYDLAQAKAAFLNGFLRIEIPAAPATPEGTKRFGP